MAYRTTAQEVRDLITTSKSDSVIEVSFIKTANTFVNEVLASSGLSDDMLKEIELYLAAHFCTLAVENGGITGQKLGDASESYANTYGPGLSGTRFGQAALTMDYTGTLVRVSSTRPRAELRIV